MAWTGEHPLLSPIETDGGEKITRLTLREPPQFSLELADEEAGGHAKIGRPLADLCEQSPDDLRKLGALDYRNLSELVSAFLQASGLRARPWPTSRRCSIGLRRS